MNPTNHELVRLAVSQLWQVTVLALLVAAVVRLAGRHRPHLTYLLWLLVVIKCLTPPLWSSPAGVFSWALLR
ncbi:MAG: antirepressor regulating drug resistance protein, partial [Planctomycetes bacterium]|nr:antirepressor regulating drug resistance protein [Planctomycetota bacterium]